MATNTGTEDMPLASIRFCQFCSKPFSSPLSYTRHKSYCRRAQCRPKIRRKSCRACSAAKAKCSFDPRCSRCSARGLDCVYDEQLHLGLMNPTADRAISSSSEPDLQDFSHLAIANDLAMQPLDLQQPVQYFHGWVGGENEDMLRAGFIEDLSLSGQDDPSPKSVELVTGNLASGLQNGFQNAGFLTRLKAMEPLGQESKRLILDALCAIPEQMLRKSTFPPFIHPHWNSDALPESLAVCMKVAQMFALRTTDVAPFIWRIILSEQRRMLELLTDLSLQDLLAAIQAGVVYLVMRVIDGPTQSLEWNQEMAISQSILCDHFLDLCGGEFCHDELAYPSMTWEEWIFAESRRRTSSIWFLITRTLAVKTKLGCPTSERPWMLPLPSPKTQWEAKTREAWLEELQAGNPAIHTFGQLMESKQRGDEKVHRQRLDSWNARTDNLGALLNIAVAVA